MDLLKVDRNRTNSVHEFDRRETILEIGAKVEFLEGAPNLEAVKAWEAEVFTLYGKASNLYKSVVAHVHYEMGERMREKGTWTLWRAKQWHSYDRCYPQVSVEEYKMLLDEPTGTLCLLTDGVTPDGKISPPKVVFCKTAEEAQQVLKSHSVGGSRITCERGELKMHAFNE